MRVASATHTSKNIYDIKISHGRELNNLPAEMVKLFMNNDLSTMQSDYCPLNENETMQKLIKHCYEHKIQPKSYMFQGLLMVAPIKVEEHTYQHTDDSRYSA
jgi:hypothetical protein